MASTFTSQTPPHVPRSAQLSLDQAPGGRGELSRPGLDAERCSSSVTGVEAIAAAAGVTRCAVYHHYADKAGLFRAVLREAQRSVAESVDRAAALRPDPSEALEAGCQEFLTASSSPSVRRVVLVDTPAVLGWQGWGDEDAAHSGRLSPMRSPT